MTLIHYMIRAAAALFTALVLLAFVGVESGCDGGRMESGGMVETPKTSLEEATAGEGYTSHKPRGKGSSKVRPRR